MSHQNAPKARRRYLLFPAFLVAAIALPIVPLATAGTAAQSRTATTIHVKAGEMFFKLSTKTLAKPGSVTFVVTNGGRLEHDFRIDGKQTRLLRPGQTARLTVRFAKKGKYRYLCTVPGHAAAGMKGVFTVR